MPNHYRLYRATYLIPVMENENPPASAPALRAGMGVDLLGLAPSEPRVAPQWALGAAVRRGSPRSPWTWVPRLGLPLAVNLNLKESPPPASWTLVGERRQSSYPLKKREIEVWESSACLGPTGALQAAPGMLQG